MRVTTEYDERVRDRCIEHAAQTLGDSLETADDRRFMSERFADAVLVAYVVNTPQEYEDFENTVGGLFLVFMGGAAAAAEAALEVE